MNSASGLFSEANSSERKVKPATPTVRMLNDDEMEERKSNSRQLKRGSRSETQPIEKNPLTKFITIKDDTLIVSKKQEIRWSYWPTNEEEVIAPP